MKMMSMNISKFRSINRALLYFNDLDAIVGQNNSGKSAILRALNSFFNPELEIEYFINKSHSHSSNSTPTIEIVLTDLPDKEPFISHKNGANNLCLKMTFSNKEKELKYFVKSKSTYKKLPKRLKSAIFNEIGFVLIPAIRNHEQTISNEKTILKNLLDMYLNIHTSKRDNLSAPVNLAVNNLQNVALDRVARKLDSVYSTRSSFNFLIKHVNNITYRLLLENLSLNIAESSKIFKLIDCGSGIQSLANIAIYRYISQLLNKKIILGIEEPEINLHPQAQREFINNLKTSVGSYEVQVILSTHSAVIIDKLDHNKIILCKKEPDIKRGFITKVYQLSNDFWVKHKFEDIKYNKFFLYHNSEFFFSNYIIVVEGSTDAEIVKYLAREADVDLDTLGISILNSDGSKNFKYPFYLLKELNIPRILIMDKDFFLKYSHDKKENSRNKRGFYTYKKQYQDEELIKEIINNSTDRNDLLKLFNSNHSEAMNRLALYDTICFKYNLEMDLVNSSAAQNKFYDLFHILPPNRNTKFLLENYKNAIKEYPNLYSVLSNINHSNLPNSYKRIKRQLINLKRKLH